MDKLSSKGIKSVALTGDDSVNYRQIVIEKLREEVRLTIFITVDLFNEGIDIPEVNRSCNAETNWESSIISFSNLVEG